MSPSDGQEPTAARGTCSRVGHSLLHWDGICFSVASIQGSCFSSPWQCRIHLISVLHKDIPDTWRWLLWYFSVFSVLGLPFWTPAAISVIWRVFEALIGQWLCFLDTAGRVGGVDRMSQVCPAQGKRGNQEARVGVPLCLSWYVPQPPHSLWSSLVLVPAKFYPLRSSPSFSLFHPVSSSNVLSVTCDVTTFINNDWHTLCAHPCHWSKLNAIRVMSRGLQPYPKTILGNYNFIYL